jgi:uncharacterized protein (DUF2236 family)
VRFVLDMLAKPLVPRSDERSELSGWARAISDLPTTRWSVARASRLTAIGGLPAVVRARLGIPWTRRNAFELANIERSVRLGWHLLPPSVRWQPRAHDGWLRATGEVP